MALGEVIQLLTTDAIDASVATDPEIAVPVFERLKDAVVEQPMLHLVVEETAFAKSGQAVVVRAKPKRAVGIFVDGPDAIARHTLSHSVGDELSVFELRQCPVGSEPELALPVFMNHHHVVVR